MYWSDVVAIHSWAYYYYDTTYIQSVMNISSLASSRALATDAMYDLPSTNLQKVGGHNN